MKYYIFNFITFLLLSSFSVASSGEDGGERGFLNPNLFTAPKALLNKMTTKQAILEGGVEGFDNHNRKVHVVFMENPADRDSFYAMVVKEIYGNFFSMNRAEARIFRVDPVTDRENLFGMWELKVQDNTLGTVDGTLAATLRINNGSIVMKTTEGKDDTLNATFRCDSRLSFKAPDKGLYKAYIGDKHYRCDVMAQSFNGNPRPIDCNSFYTRRGHRQVEALSSYPITDTLSAVTVTDINKYARTEESTLSGIAVGLHASVDFFSLPKDYLMMSYHTKSGGWFQLRLMKKKK